MGHLVTAFLLGVLLLCSAKLLEFARAVWISISYYAFGTVPDDRRRVTGKAGAIMGPLVTASGLFVLLVCSYLLLELAWSAFRIGWVFISYYAFGTVPEYARP